jgi:hypothetical protein
LTGRRLFTSPQPIMHLMGYMHYDVQRETYTPKCVALCRNEALDMFLKVHVNLATGGLDRKEEFIADGMGELEVLQGEIDGNHEAAYLMTDPDENVHYAPPDLTKTDKIILVHAIPPLGKPEILLRKENSPMLLAAGRLSNRQGFYIRYIEGDEKFVTLKV